MRLDQYTIRILQGASALLCVLIIQLLTLAFANPQPTMAQLGMMGLSFPISFWASKMVLVFLKFLAYMNLIKIDLDVPNALAKGRGRTGVGEKTPKHNPASP